METVLSLIEMSGEEEDESLLLREDINDKYGEANINISSNSSLPDLKLSRSPPYILKSKRSSVDAARPPLPDGSKVNDGGKKHGWPSPLPPPPHEDTVDNKENLYKSNLLVSPNLKAGQQQMKRRKRGCGYNVRKSLAWNRAFFTEEGVLDPEELSLLSGPFSKPGTESLSTIEEEGRTSLSEYSTLGGNGSNVHSNEEKSLSKLPAMPSNEVHEVCGGRLPKSKTSAREDAALVHGASQKVQSTRGFHKVASREGSSTLPKQLTNRNTTNAAKKDSKLPKLLASKPDSSSTATAPKTVNLPAKHSRSNQNGATAIHTVRKSGVKGMPLSTAKKALGCTPSSTKSSAHSSLKILANSPLETPFSVNPKTIQSRKGTNIGLKVTPDPTIAIDIQASTGQAGFGNTSVLLPPNSQYVSADKQYSMNFQPTKPSGLRMPSPSLRYFDQPKSSTLHGFQCQKNTQPFSLKDSNSPDLRKVGKSENVGMVTALHAPLPMVGPDATTTRSMVGLNSGCSISSVAPATSSSNIGDVKQLHARNRLLTMDTNAETSNDAVSTNSTLGCSIAFALASSHPAPKSNLELKNQYKVEIEVPSHLTASYDTINCQEQQSHGVSNYGNKESMNLTDVAKPILDGIDDSSHEDNLILHMKDNTSLVQRGSPEKSNKSIHFENNHNVCPQNCYSISKASEISHAASPSISTMAVKEVFSGKDDLIKHSNFEDVALESISCSELNENNDVFSDTVFSDAIECCNPGTSTASADSLPTGHGLRERFNEQLEVRKPGVCQFGQAFHKGDLRKQMTDNNLLGQRTEEPREENDIPTVPDIEQNFPKDYTKLDMNGDNLVGHGRSSEELQEVNNYRHVIEVNPESSVSGGSEFQSSHFSSNLNSVSQVEVGTIGTGNLTKHQDLGDPKLESLNGDLTVDSCDHIHDPKLKDAVSNCNSGSSVLHDDCLRIGKNEYSGNQPVLRNSFPNKIEQIFQIDDHTPLKNNEALRVEMRSSKESQQDNDPDNFISITLKRKDCNASESQSPSVVSQPKLAKQDIKVSAETSKLTKQLDAGLGSLTLNMLANGDVFLHDIEADLPHNDKSQDGELQSATENGFPLKVNDTSAPVEEKTVDGSKHDSLPQLNAVPFSDEWLAALEAAGEEILTRKSGAVQHSPPDKSLPEPSPWSPVKRKGIQEIGPFDCTKYNLPSSPN